MRYGQSISVLAAVVLLTATFPTRASVPVVLQQQAPMACCQAGGKCCQLGCCLRKSETPTQPLAPLPQREDWKNPFQFREATASVAVISPSASSCLERQLRLMLLEPAAEALWSLQQQHVRLQI